MSQTTTSPDSRTPRASRAALLVTALCWAIVVFDGYDLIVYGTVLPELLDEPDSKVHALPGQADPSLSVAISTGGHPDARALDSPVPSVRSRRGTAHH